MSTLERLALLVTDAGSHAATMGSAVLLALVLLLRARGRAGWWPAWPVVAVGGAILDSTLLKRLIDRPRPPENGRLLIETSPSFPSGHATGSAALALVVVVLVWRGIEGMRRQGRAGSTALRGLVVLGAAVYVLVIGASRVVLGVHYVSDVLGGWALAIAWVAVVALLVLPRLSPGSHPARTPSAL